MSLIEILIIAFALAVDAFTVGAAVGLVHRQPRQIFRLSFHFGLFQALMPLLGAGVGAVLGDLIAPWSHWIAFILLAFIGVRMIHEALILEKTDSKGDPTRGFALIGLSIAVSIDALAVGFTLGLRDVSIFIVVLIIGLIAAAMTTAGMILAGKFALKQGKKAEIVAGVVLIILGIKILLEHWI